MFGRKKNLTTIEETPVSEDGGNCTIMYEYNDAVIAPFVRWVDRELAAGRRFRAWHANVKEENKSLKVALAKTEAECEKRSQAQLARIAAMEIERGLLNQNLAKRIAEVSEFDVANIRLKRDLRQAEENACFLARDATGFMEQARKAEARAEAAEKRLREPLQVVERTIWRVRAKAAELAALRAVPPGTDPTVRAVEFWRAVRKLGVPVDQVKDFRQHLDYFEFFDFAELNVVGVGNTTVFEIG